MSEWQAVQERCVEMLHEVDVHDPQAVIVMSKEVHRLETENAKLKTLLIAAAVAEANRRTRVMTQRSKKYETLERKFGLCRDHVKQLEQTIKSLMADNDRMLELRGMVNVLADKLAEYEGSTVPDEIRKAREIVERGG